MAAHPDISTGSMEALLTVFICDGTPPNGPFILITAIIIFHWGSADMQAKR